MLGFLVGERVGLYVGRFDGALLGFDVGTRVGLYDGNTVGLRDCPGIID